jgi:ATP-dependent helicase/nuclease subunit A
VSGPAKIGFLFQTVTQHTDTTPSKWTDEQSRGISTIGHSLLVSAAAGSGKTAVLAERCAHLVCGSQPPCDIDELLVVTFTRAAAAEMRGRIETAIRQRLEQSDEEADGRLARQVALLDRASIGTLHSFCTTILREHFHLIGLDPAFTLMEEDQSKLLRLETARELFADRYDGEDAARFQSFVDQYADGRDEALIQRVISTHDLLCSVVDPVAWRKHALDRIIDGSQGTLAKSELGKLLVADVRDRLADLQARCVAAVEAFDREDGLAPYAEHVNELQATVQWWIECFRDGSFDRLADAVRNVQIPKLPTIPGATPGKDAAQDTINTIKDQMKAKGALAGLCQFSETEWKDGLERTIEQTETFLGLVAEFTSRFDAAKRAQRSLDFSDLERLTLNVLSEGTGPSAVARLYHKRFMHVLVDEYQDINEVQDRILSLLSRESVLRHDALGGNLFCVGDVKQSIYRFRLAQPRQFRDRADRFGRGKPRNGGEAIDLRTNFRSRAPLLDCLNGLFERLMTRNVMEIEYDDSHRLRAPEHSPYDAIPCDGPPVVLHLLPSPGNTAVADETEEAIEEDRTQREAGFVAAEIGKIVAAGKMVLDKETGQGRPVRFGDIAILLRSMKFKADQFAQALRIAKIPVHSDSSTGFFSSTEVRDILSLLAVLDNQQQDIPLAAVLRSPLMQIPHPEDVLASARLASPDSGVPFHVAIDDHAPQSSKLADALHTLETWRELANTRPLAEALWAIYSESGYLSFCSGLSDGEQCVANLLALHERAKQFDKSGQRQGLGRFRLFLDALREESDLGQPSIAVEGDNAVRVMSIHRSKGLEFPIVIVPDLGKKHNFQSCMGTILVDRNAYVGLSVVDEEKRVRYPSLAHAMAKESIRRQTLAEELRVLYVAATRACERLILVGTSKVNAADEWQAEYATHVGPLSPGTLLGGQTPLDWLGPATSALAATSPALISIVDHEQQELVAQQRSPRPVRTELQEQLANLRPLDPSPPMNERAQSILQRLDHRYRFSTFSGVPAARSVSQLAAEGHRPFGVRLAAPQSAEAVFPLGATEIGDATHVFMEHLDVQQADSASKIAGQLQRMINQRFLTKDAAESIDLAGVAWFVSSDLGQLMQTHASVVRRELPLYFAREQAAVAAQDPLDRTMVRGRIDVLIPLPDRCILIDYKTDRIVEGLIDTQVAHHRPQLSLYSKALESVLNRPVEAYLAFLTARQSRKLPAVST